MYEFFMTDLVKGFISDPSRCINRSGEVLNYIFQKWLRWGL